MFMRMVYDDRLAQAAYIIGCQQTGEAIVVDPQRDVDRYIELAKANELRIVAAAETHIHADFLSGARELAEAVGATVYVSGEGGPDWQYQWLDQNTRGGSYDSRLLSDGDSFQIGRIGFEVVHTPGHTPEHVCFLVTDHGGGADAPIGILTGDFLFVRDLGRPDLLETAADQAGMMEPSARQLHRSLQRLAALPEFIQVWPGHGAGSACGKALGAVPMSTLGYERRFNPAIRRAAEGEQRFIDFILEGQPEPPVYFARMKQKNRAGPRVLGGATIPPRVDVQVIASLGATERVVIDTRSWEGFRQAHLPCSLSFPMSTAFTTDVGSMVRDRDDIWLIVEPEDIDDVVRCLVRIGLDRIRGWCTPAELAEWFASGGQVASIGVASPTEAAEMIDAGAAQVLDVRRATEFVGGHLPGATNIAHTRLAVRLDEIPSEGTLLVNCQSGRRSACACAYLARFGRDVVDLDGGYNAWWEANAPRVTGPVYIGPGMIIPPSDAARVIDAGTDEVAQWLDANEAVLIDVREDSEYDAEHIEGSVHMPLSRFDPAALRARLGDARAVFQCRSGKRSVAAALAYAHGHAPLLHLAGGILAWKHDGRSVVRPS